MSNPWELCSTNFESRVCFDNSSWEPCLGEVLTSFEMVCVFDFLNKKIDQKEVFFPFPKDVFRAFDLCEFDDARVVIIGQDPYHSFEILNNKIVPHAQGLSFSISPKSKKTPPSLRNIYKALETQIPGFEKPNNGDLSAWAERGVLLLNSVLTVNPGEPNSHEGIGWEIFTDEVIRQISDHKSGVVFLLWGKYAQSKRVLIDDAKHKIIECSHPSPFSAHRGFYDSRCFEQVEEILGEEGIWTI